MPTVHREDGFRFFFYSNESDEPPHIHVEKGDGCGKFWLNPVALTSSSGFKSQELRRAREIVEANTARFLEGWDEHFGD